MESNEDFGNSAGKAVQRMKNDEQIELRQTFGPVPDDVAVEATSPGNRENQPGSALISSFSFGSNTQNDARTSKIDDQDDEKNIENENLLPTFFNDNRKSEIVQKVPDKESL
jgi:hypothetical protein